ncbi:MAG TPA: ABC transporter substrate-binding protein, partial [Thermoplasmata archaeon]|nr:ABC transporter substrate-binding protein [Thermoplasmata archaeon]
MKRSPRVLALAFLVGAVLATPIVAVERGPEATQGDLTLIVGGQDEMKIRNILPAIANDVWTQDVLDRVYDSVGKAHPITDQPAPYIVKGVDADGDGIFQRDEYGRFNRDPVDWQGFPCDATPATNFCALIVTAFYDFNGVYFHDGAQADAYDLLFTYHLFAMNPRYNTDLRVIMDVDFTNNRQMGIAVVDATSVPPVTWADAPPAGASAALRTSLKFVMNEPFVLFYESTLNGGLLPQHAWEKTGQRGDAPVTPYATNIHTDFGCLIYPPTASGAYTDTTKKGTGIPSGASDLPAGCTAAYSYPAAEGWAMTDADVIGTGPFRFDTWVQGGFAKVVRNDQFFVGQNPYSPFEVWDPYLLTYIKLPTIDAIVYNIYRSTTLGVLALRQSKIDFYHWNVPAEFVPELLADPNIAVEANPEPGFF